MLKAKREKPKTHGSVFGFSIAGCKAGVATLRLVRLQAHEPLFQRYLNHIVGLAAIVLMVHKQTFRHFTEP